VLAYHLLDKRNALSAILGPCNRLGFASSPFTESVASRPAHLEEEVSLLYFYGRTASPTIAYDALRVCSSLPLCN
jgi:hypothetical protein